jgi:hypothetical protein
MHRGELSVEEATDFLVEHTAFEHANAQAEVFRYTYTPTYQLSYLLGKVLLLQLRADEQRRLGDRFSLKNFHDTLLRNGSLPISFHRRLLATDAAASGGSEAARPDNGSRSDRPAPLHECPDGADDRPDVGPEPQPNRIAAYPWRNTHPRSS